MPEKTIRPRDKRGRFPEEPSLPAILTISLAEWQDRRRERQKRALTPTPDRADLTDLLLTSTARLQISNEPDEPPSSLLLGAPPAPSQDTAEDTFPHLAIVLNIPSNSFPIPITLLLN
ncbi:hypothetical protein Trco_006930 [Trichoderma cornu-damae]|uniref:Uncharacterized protein n=1 Tax=Trichoderma cornu-damae TaxID=654480 RepID=A0A9P8QLI3_9HYPO|nr:hypothetical protein Trco_006930 [Trichoderma cornu-damae]